VAVSLAYTSCLTVFCSRNNGYAISTPTRDQYRGDGIGMLPHFMNLYCIYNAAPPIGRIIMHLARTSVRPSVSPVQARNSKIKKCRQITISINVSHGTSKWSANFQRL